MRPRIAEAALCVLLAALTCSAGEEASRHKAKMDEAQDLKDEIQDGLDGKSASKVADAAAKLRALCQQEEQLWIRARVAEAIRLAGKNLQAVRELEAGAKTGDLDSAAKAFERLNASCRACHDLHLEKAHRNP